MFVLGTAGHVDHGKSALVRALTGIDPDRLREEKERGLTIDLGFAWLSLPSGRDVSIVDVPGHERFIKNMLAGAGGVDIAMLVAAADEGPMPQTREHLAILDILDVPTGLVVITKTDLVEDDYLDLVEAELAEILATSRLADAPILRASAYDGRGIDDILKTLDSLLDTTPRKRDLGRPRLPIDRAFTIQGFGSVVTGTLVDGALEVGQDIELQPGRIRGRVRGLQRHKEKVDRLEPGTRAAVNLGGVRAEDLERGMVLARPGTLRPTRAIDLRLRATDLLPHPVSHSAGITFLCATSESQGQLRLLDRDELLPGDECWAQVRLENPVAVAPGDHCVIRTTNDTIGGGPVISINAPRHRRKDPAMLEALRRKAEGTIADRILDELLSGPATRQSLAQRLGVEQAEAEEAIRELLGAASIRDVDGQLMSQAWLEITISRVAAETRTFLSANPLRDHAPREHVRSASGLEQAVFDRVVAIAAEDGQLEERAAGLATPGHQASLTPAQEKDVARFLSALRQGGYSPPTDDVPSQDLLAYLATRGDIELTRAGIAWDAGVYRDMVEQVRAAIESNGSISLAEVRDMFGTSRKYAQAFLEHLDEQRITRRVGDTRVLRGG